MESSAHRYPSESGPETQSAQRPPTRGRRWVRRLRTVSAVLVGLVALYALLGFFALPAYLGAKAPAILSERLGRPVTVGDITFNPFTLALAVKEFDITEQDGSPLVGFEELYVNVGVSSILNRTLTFDQIRLRIPYGLAKIRRDGTLNLMDLRPKSPTPGTTPPVQAMQEKSDDQRSLPALIIRSLEIEQGAVEFHDESRPTPFSADIVPIWLTLKNFRTIHAGDNAFAFKAEFEAGESLEWQGALLLNPLRSDGYVKLSSLKMREVWEYIQDRAGFEITDGLLHVDARYHAEAGADAFHATISDGEIGLENVTLLEKGNPTPLIVLPHFVAKGIQADLVQHHVEIGVLQSHGARITGWIDKEGVVNLRHVFAPAPPGPQANLPATPSPSTRQPTPWTVALKEIDLDDYGLSMEDRRPSSPVHLDVGGLHVRVKNVTYPSTGALDFDASMRINTTGHLSTSGTVTADPMTADLEIEVGQFPLTPFQPYIGRAANLELHKGSANLKGQLRYAAAEHQSIRFHGDASISQLATVDSQLNKDLVNWESLNVNKIDLALPSDHVTIGEIIATKPYADIIISADRTVNIRTILTKSDQSKSTITESKPQKRSIALRPLPVAIGSVKIRGGSAHFADFSVQPIVDTGIYELKGAIKGLSSKEQTRADVTLQGEVDKYAPVNIAGQINPLSHNAFTDLTVSFKNVELTTLSPYSTKFAGYPIVKGKLSMDLHYKLEQQQLEANNEVLIDQLTLGDKVDSPGATSLPVKLAIALLKDRHGRINIDLPVKGDLSNPEFEYGKLIWNVFTNLLTKVVTSPFSLMAKLVGGNSDELSEVPFPVGSAEIPPEKVARLKALAKSLEERPQIQLEITGSADPMNDGTALSEVKLQSALDALKQEAGKNERRSQAYAERDDTEDAGLLKALYVKKFGRLPDQTDRNQPVPPEQLRERLLHAFPVEEAELRLLAQERGKQIQHFLINETGISADRVFLLDAKLTAHAQNGAVASRLNLTAG